VPVLVADGKLTYNQEEKTMKHFVFLLGRPGCGKSVVYKIIKEAIEKKGIEAPRVDDFLTLKAIFDKDTEFKRHVLKDGGFAVTDWTVVDEALKDLCTYVRKDKSDKKIIFIEFARDNYKHAFENFSKDVLDDSVILYLYSTFEECYKRNVARFEKAKKEGHDDHIVPLDLMKTYYRTDDYEQLYLKSEAELMKNVPAKTIVLDSSVSGEAGIVNLRKQIEKGVINELF
jgi:adenylate kinase family enzyme